MPDTCSSHHSGFHPPNRATRTPSAFVFAALAALIPGCANRLPPRVNSAPPAGVYSAPSTPKPPFQFDSNDQSFLDEVQHGAFNFLWNEGNAKTGMVPDRMSKPEVVSVAGVGFQLSALPIGVERGWITREQGRERANRILTTLAGNPRIVKAGFFQHFIDADTADLHHDKLEHVVSTIDSALLFCGMITAAAYFEGDVKQQSDALFAAADFRFFLSGAGEHEEWKKGFISLGWKPEKLSDPNGEGSLLPYYWLDSGCEHRLVTFLGVCAPNEQNRISPETYYRLRRTLGEYQGGGAMVWFPYSGALFVNQFSHCWINYAAIGADDPAAFGFSNQRRAPVDWWENARRMTAMHQAKAVEASARYKTLGQNSWGLSASDCPKGYCVPGVFPKPVDMPGAKPKLDFATEHPKDDFGDGTIAPYAAGTAIMFDPTRAIAALRHYRSLQSAAGKPLIWNDPNAKTAHNYGFNDAFNLDVPWASTDFVSIDQGPLLLAIENARTGLIWRLFSSHPWVKDGMARLKLKF